jgi:extradiol dioxygenase family protein
MALKLGFVEEGLMSTGLIFNFFGHQLVCHIGESVPFSNEVDGKDVPIPHFWIVLDWKEFDIFSETIKSNNIDFVIEPYLRFRGLPGEQKDDVL